MQELSEENYVPEIHKEVRILLNSLVTVKHVYHFKMLNLPNLCWNIKFLINHWLKLGLI